jgi:hypothetical protein
MSVDKVCPDVVHTGGPVMGSTTDFSQGGPPLWSSIRCTPGGAHRGVTLSEPLESPPRLSIKCVAQEGYSKGVAARGVPQEGPARGVPQRS